MYDYFCNAAKTCLIAKPDQLDSGQTLFKGTNIQISCEGQGAAIGKRAFTEEYVSRKVQMWLEEIRTSSNIAQSHPHIAYSTFTHSVKHQ